MKANEILKSLLRKVVVMLVVVAMFAVWTVLMSVILIPTAVYIVAVMPIMMLCGVKFDSNKLLLRISDILFEDSFDFIERAVCWIHSTTKQKDEE